MSGKKFEDKLIQEYWKNWTFNIIESETSGILIHVDNKTYKRFEISGMILKEIMNLVNYYD